MDTLSWRDEAACLRVDSNMFFDGYRTAEAQAVCGRCPVLPECRAYALVTRQDHGVWGGLTEDRREQILQAAVPTEDDAPLVEVTYTTRTRSTGATCSAGRTADGSWGVVCVSHDRRGVAPSRTAAENAVARPRDWCPECRQIAGKKLPRVVG